MKDSKHKNKTTHYPQESIKVTSEMASMAPNHKPDMKKSHPAAQFKEPKGGEQSLAPDTKKKTLPTEHAPKGVATPNSGHSMEMPKGGGPGESKV